MELLFRPVHVHCTGAWGLTFIAAVALEQDVWLLHNDSDFTLIAREFPLKIYPQS